ncbi:3-oxoacyl-ACP reductase [Pseudonocardiaceae bacterium YIM PH 21723]|nr:3-oxoacyl-ACP reductase [Pseudonocardiaceae bacterium YIM PH 21723]
MSDQYTKFAQSGFGGFFVKRLGLPNPVPLRRYKAGQPVVDGTILFGSSEGARLTDSVNAVFKSIGAEVATEYVRPASKEQPGAKHAALVFDATGIKDSTQLKQAYEFFHNAFRSVNSSGRLIVLGSTPEELKDPRERTAQRSLEGLTRSLGKEAQKGATANLIYVAPGAEGAIESTLRFFLSAKSAYVSGQVAKIGKGKVEEPANWDKPLEGKVALVTGAARGIGESIAETFARDGAKVIVLDVPQAGEDLSKVANRIGGSALQLDITAADAGQKIAEFAKERHGGLDIVVHNAGVTRDKLIANMDEKRWDLAIAINLTAQEDINAALLEAKAINKGGRIITISSIAGIAGNRGQTNYGTTKAGVIGLAQSWAPEFAKNDITINVIAPGTIETKMFAAVPLTIKEAARRMNSLSQGGQPVDVAEGIAWFASPASGGLTANVVRVCGQHLIGA